MQLFFRILFLVQIVTQYLEQMKINERTPIVKKEIKNCWVGSSVTIGLAVKRFWKKIDHISDTLAKVDRKLSMAMFSVHIIFDWLFTCN